MGFNCHHTNQRKKVEQIYIYICTNKYRQIPKKDTNYELFKMRFKADTMEEAMKL